MFSRLGPYEKYQASPGRWIPDPPRHWEVLPAASVLKPVTQRNKTLQETTVLSLSYGRVIVKPIEKLRGLVPESFETYQVLEPGDIVVRPTDLQNDKTSLRVGQVNDHGIITSAYLGFRVQGMNASYAAAYLATLDHLKIFYGMGSGLRQNLDLADFKRLPLLAPPAPEQAAIVKYLAHADSRIERAIAAKRKLIALLEEQRQAVSYDAVTLGLVPGTPRRESHVPWLRQIPRHWELAPTRAALRLTKSVVGDSHETKPLLSLTKQGVIVRDLSDMKGKFSADQSSFQDVRPGQFVFCMFDVDETPRTVGLSKVEGMITGAYRVFDCVDAQWAPFVELYFLAMDDRKLLKPLYTGLRKTIPVGAFLQSKMPFPPERERDEIVEHVSAHTRASNLRRDLALREIELLREFRTRLTADVVTGQVDVREVASTLPDSPNEGVAAMDLEAFGGDLEDVDGEGEAFNDTHKSE